MIHAYAVHESGKSLEPFDYDPGGLADDEVEIEVESCGICHSDMSMIDDEWGITQFPMVPGHEVVGTVSKAGSRTDHVLVGDLVGLGWHAGYCMQCTACLSGDHNLCASAQSTIIGHNGGFADKVRARAMSVVRIPKGIDRQSAGPLFCGGITVFNPMLQLGVKPTDHIGVIGIGGLGHLAVQFCRAWGCEVTAFTSTENKRSEILDMGAHRVINTHDTSAIESLAGHFDFIIATVNLNLDWNAFAFALAPRGRMVMVGAILEQLNVMNLPLIMGQRSVAGSTVGSPATIAKMLEFAARHGIKPVIESFSFDRVNEALSKLRRGEARYRVVLNH